MTAKRRRVHMAFRPFVGLPNLCPVNYKCATIEFDWGKVTCRRCKSKRKK